MEPGWASNLDAKKIRRNAAGHLMQQRMAPENGRDHTGEEEHKG